MNLTLSGSLFLIDVDDIQSENFNYTFDSNIFKEITLQGSKAQNLIDFNNIGGLVMLRNSNFSDISFFNNLLVFKKIKGDLLIDQIIFNQNEVLSYIINIEDCLNLSLINTISTQTNFRNSKLFDGGGNFRFYNVIYKKISNLEISKSFSMKKAFGLTIIDNYEENYLPKPFVNT